MTNILNNSSYQSSKQQDLGLDAETIIQYFQNFDKEKSLKLHKIGITLQNKRQEANNLSVSPAFIDFVDTFFDKEENLNNSLKEKLFADIVSPCTSNNTFLQNVPSFLQKLPEVVPFHYAFMGMFTSLIYAHSDFIKIDTANANRIVNLISPSDDNDKIYDVLVFISDVLKYNKYITSYNMIKSFVNHYQTFVDLIVNDNLTLTNKINAFNILLILPLSESQIEASISEISSKYDSFPESLKAKVLQYMNTYIPADAISVLLTPTSNSALQSQILANINTVLNDSSLPSYKQLVDSISDDIWNNLNVDYEHDITDIRFNPFIADLGVLLSNHKDLFGNEIDIDGIAKKLKDRQEKRKEKYATTNNETKPKNIFPFKTSRFSFFSRTKRKDTDKLPDSTVDMGNIWLFSKDDINESSYTGTIVNQGDFSIMYS